MRTGLFFLGLLLLAPVSAGADTLDFAMGKALFDRPWSSAPASTQATDGLGPLFNARSCVACHPSNGRGHFSVNEDGSLEGSGYVIRLGNERGEGDPVYGRQLQTNAIHAHKSEARITLHDTQHVFHDMAYGPLSDQTQTAGRIAQPLHGLGLLEQVSDEAILRHADPDDRDHDGVSGRPNMIDGEIGRFAWKASAVSLQEQAAIAFSNDIGMSTPLRPAHAGDCTEHQKDCLDGPHGNSPQYEGLEIDSQILGLVTAYLKGLRPLNQTGDQDNTLFRQTGCAACHVPTFPLPDGRTVTAYTDLLLHDMGDGLADGIREGDASGREWRTQPLWGTAQTRQFLHDGRAQTVEEAIHWHDGEARNARQKFEALSPADRQRLLDFVNNL